jgi:DNA topoisomerase-1
MLPKLEEGETLTPDRLVPAQHFTQPPPRYNDATLVKELESRGIGRPSTYAATISVLRVKAYAEGTKGQLKPTEMGFMVNDLLVGSFPRLLDYDFTADMEEDLDQIEEGHAERLAVLKKLYSPLAESLATAKESMLNVKTDGLPVDTPCPKCGHAGEVRIRYGKSGFYLSCAACGATCDFTRDEHGCPVPEPVPELSEEVACPECGKPMQIKKGRFGPFLACTGYPDCRFTRPVRVEDGKAIPMDGETPDFPEDAPRECPRCGAPMAVKRAHKGSWFIGCTRYPKCKETRPFPTGFRCPVDGCTGQLVERTSFRGPFLGCSRYPDCRYLVRGELVKDPCPVCGFPYRIRKTSSSGLPGPLRCPNTACPTYEKPSSFKGEAADSPKTAARAAGRAKRKEAGAGAKAESAAPLSGEALSKAESARQNRIAALARARAAKAQSLQSSRSGTLSAEKAKAEPDSSHQDRIAALARARAAKVVKTQRTKAARAGGTGGGEGGPGGNSPETGSETGS